ncbi:MAG: class I SAM-dependent DNA methyltransferase, partial [Bacteroidetes bacterium]|nr:class I SAM-dependent DNA methyltransferase [Bacteroidota bacterium]
MRLSWNEIRIRAREFSGKWENAVYEKGETQSFYNDFFEIFGVQRRNVARYEEHVKKLDNRSGFIDLFWPGILIVEQKSAGLDLGAAYEQAGEYFDALSEYERPQYILVSDFQNFDLYDLDERETVSFSLAELHLNIEAFSFILGVQRRVFRDQDPANITAAELVGRLHDLLDEVGYRGDELERFLVRIVFCLFADDTGIFEPRDIFLEFIENRTRSDGSDLGPWLAHLFQIMNTSESTRLTVLDENLAQFPYVDGDLFRGDLRIPSFDSAMRQALLDICQFDWSNISPAIFGALFQSVMD